MLLCCAAASCFAAAATAAPPPPPFASNVAAAPGGWRTASRGVEWSARLKIRCCCGGELEEIAHTLFQQSKLANIQCIKTHIPFFSPSVVKSDYSCLGLQKTFLFAKWQNNERGNYLGHICQTQGIGAKSGLPYLFMWASSLQITSISSSNYSQTLKIYTKSTNLHIFF